MFVDAHIHLSDSAYNGRIPEVIATARQNGVVAIVANSVNLETSRLSLKLAEEHQELVHAALGIHPSNANQLASTELEKTMNFVSESVTLNKRVVAIGEIGLDPQYAERSEHKKQQGRVFNEMLKLAERLALPIIVHSRWSAQEILATLPSYRLRRALWHWFSGPLDLLPSIAERGDYISEGPPAVFSDRIQEVVRHVPLERLLTETDGPVRYYGPFKDKSTTPALIPEIVKSISRVKKIEEFQVAQQILHNFTGFFDVQL
jgi:TatD DNase family protein